MMIPIELGGKIKSDPEILGGTPCFEGTRVPLATFLDHVEAGFSIDRFLQGYPSVSRQQVLDVLEWLSNESRKSVGLEIAS
jgi:uncharacterized protein (DUF433 family)